jgi:ABC-type uncharacterized transport system permease subunit
MLMLIVVLRTLAEVAGLALVGQGILFLLAGASREQNVFYRVLKTLTMPVWRAVRFITPRFVVDRHIGFLAFLLLAVGWFLLVDSQARQCRDQLGHPLCERLQQEYVKRCEAGSMEACDVLRRQATTPEPAAR